MSDGADNFGDPLGDPEGRRWQFAFEQLFNPHPSHVALVGLDGLVIAVNAAWREYGRANGLPAEYQFVGQNYLAVCEAGVAAGHPGAQEAYLGLVGVLRNGRPKFTMVYPCHSPRQRAWYRMWVEPQSPSVPAVIVAHQLVSARPVAEGETGVGYWSPQPGASGRVDARSADDGGFRGWQPGR